MAHIPSQAMQLEKVINVDIVILVGVQPSLSYGWCQWHHVAYRHISHYIFFVYQAFLVYMCSIRTFHSGTYMPICETKQTQNPFSNMPSSTFITVKYTMSIQSDCYSHFTVNAQLSICATHENSGISGEFRRSWWYIRIRSIWPTLYLWGHSTSMVHPIGTSMCRVNPWTSRESDFHLK